MRGIADYTFIRALGEGNHGTFWLANSPDRLGLPANAQVAVKTLAQQATDEEYKRMGNELRVYARVDSAHLVPILDAGHQDGRLFYTTEYFQDGSLAAPSRPLDRSMVRSAVSAACRAAHALHEAGIAHRDIKPSNIMLRGDRAFLADLGLAQIINPGQTITGVGPVGTIEYLSPETIRGAKAGRSSDVWSLGVTLHRVLSGRTLYTGLPEASLLDALRYVLTDRPVIDPSLSEREHSLVSRCLEPEPSDRFASAAELGEQIDALEDLS